MGDRGGVYLIGICNETYCKCTIQIAVGRPVNIHCDYFSTTHGHHLRGLVFHRFVCLHNDYFVSLVPSITVKKPS